MKLNFQNSKIVNPFEISTNNSKKNLKILELNGRKKKRRNLSKKYLMKLWGFQF